ncbi:hypothetical protein [Actinomadura monticuli]|uniref:Uncharacterized protein n=1 Tax=Actinomadura monticuli TaxID=3097367 RepID=A0ABV4QAD9_9ACTN
MDSVAGTRRARNVLARRGMSVGRHGVRDLEPDPQPAVIELVEPPRLREHRQNGKSAPMLATRIVPTCGTVLPPASVTSIRILAVST